MHRGGWGIVLACAAAVGCGVVSHRPTVSEIVHSLTPPCPIDGLILESVLIEQPVGDPFLNGELWAKTLAVGAPETRALCVENGLRVGVLAGSVPQKFQTLLDCETDTVGPRRQTFRQRKDTVLPTAEPPDPCRFTLRSDFAGVPKVVEFRLARCGLAVKPEPTTDGRVLLACEPVLQHGTRRDWYRPSEDGTRFTRHEEVPTERFPELAFSAVLRPDDYLLVGWDVNRPDSLGARMFATEVQGRPRQRLLVVRARQVCSSPEPPDLPPIEGALKRPSTATQAAALSGRARPPDR
jgi:hypothetical protein